MSNQPNRRQSALGYGILALGSTVSFLFFYSPKNEAPTAPATEANGLVQGAMRERDYRGKLGSKNKFASLNDSNAILDSHALGTPAFVQEVQSVPVTDSSKSDLVPLKKIESLLPIATSPPKKLTEFNDAVPLDKQYPAAETRLPPVRPQLLSAIPEGTFGAKSSAGPELIPLVKGGQSEVKKSIDQDPPSRFGAGKYRPSLDVSTASLRAPNPILNSLPATPTPAASNTSVVARQTSEAGSVLSAPQGIKPLEANPGSLTVLKQKGEVALPTHVDPSHSLPSTRPVSNSLEAPSLASPAPSTIHQPRSKSTASESKSE